MTGHGSIHPRLRGLAGAEAGQSLVLIVLTLGVILAMAAFGIDVASWYQKHHQAQVTADAASLAAANCLANAGMPGSNNVCTSTTDTTDAATVATQVAARNGVTLGAGDVQFGGGQVTVSARLSAPAFFAGIAGISGSTQSARSVASFVGPDTATCTTAGAGCQGIFAMDTNCSKVGFGINVTGGSANLQSMVHSNANLTISGGGNVWTGPNTYSNQATCTATQSGTGPAATAEAPIMSWPYDWSQHLPPCTITSTAASWTFTPASGNVYCAVGSGNPSDPSTWNGTITLSVSAPNDTFIGGSVTLQKGNHTYSADNYPTNKLWIYATASSKPVNVTGGGNQFDGDIFAPNGLATVSGGSAQSISFIQAWDVTISGGSNLAGDGPTNATGTVTPGSDALAQ